MRTPPQVGSTLKRYEQPVVFKRGVQAVVGYLPVFTYTDDPARACIQHPRSQDLRNLEIDDSLRYIKSLSRTKYPIAMGDLITYKGADYKVVSVQPWDDYGYFRAIAEEYTHYIPELDIFPAAVCDYVCNLLSYMPELVIFGRNNYYRTDKQGEYIVIDEAGLEVEGRTKHYSHQDEVVTHGAVVSNTYTVSFYGIGARRRVMDFINLQRSQDAQDLQRKFKISVGNATTPQDLKILDGTQYHEWWQVEIICKYTDALDIDLLRIDKPQINPLIIDK